MEEQDQERADAPLAGQSWAPPGAPAWDAPSPPSSSVPEAPPAVPAAAAYAPPRVQPTGHTPPGLASAAPTFRSWQPGIIPLRPLSFGDFLSAPFKAMRFNRAVVIGGPLLFTLASTALAVTSLWLLFNDPQLGLRGPSLATSGINPETVIVGVLALIAALLADVLSSTIIAPAVARAVLGERITLRFAWDQVRVKFGSIVLLYVVTTVTITVVIVIAALPLIAAVVAENTAGIVLSALVVVAVLVPAGFILTLVTGLARPIIVLEQIGAFAALARSWRLIKGRFWWSVLIVFVTAVLINIVTSVLQTGGQIVATMTTLIAPENTVVLMIAFFVLFGLAMVVAFVVTYSYMGSVFTLMYIDMRMRHEGFDLDLARAAEARNHR